MAARLLTLFVIGFKSAFAVGAQGPSKDSDSYVILDWPTARAANSEIHLLSTEAEYSSLWRKARAGEGDWLRRIDKPKASRAPVDFSRKKIVAIFWGSHPSANYLISIKSVKAGPESCEVEAATQIPSGADYDAVSFPAAAVALPKTCKLRLAISGPGSQSFSRIKIAGVDLKLH